MLKPTVDRDLKTLAVFIHMYCQCQHPDASKEIATLKTHDVQEIAGKEIKICPECYKLLAHAFTKRAHCPMDPKPQCKHCPNQCYAPAYKDKIREVMRFSGKKMVMSGRVDMLLHLLF